MLSYSTTKFIIRMDLGIALVRYGSNRFGNRGCKSSFIMEGGGVLTAERSPARANLHVAFTEKGEVKERREKFLTAKYGSHQMSLIRKRLAVEMWLFDELEKLYEAVNDSGKNREVEIDIDELLDMDSDDHRRRFLQELLVDTKKPPHDINKFINDLLEKAKTL
ncbi:protein phosphatase 1 regulatory subunit 14B isoform X2 [Lasioglossum baleicum]|uniref:protein phosphatase 1 regulatory subunit 14B isoform X2 n=1 Tax=Lasioglossum baleicum TaxID=434251 RepID=UPI003FCEC29C